VTSQEGLSSVELIKFLNFLIICEILGSHGSQYEDNSLLGCDTL
jgi:hypothetical protein